MTVTVRPLRADEGRIYLDIVGRAIRGLATGHYSPEALDGWVPQITDDALHDLMLNADQEIRLVAELDGTPAGIGALVVAGSELRACYVVPEAAGRGCGSVLVREIERLAREHGLIRLELAASLNAEVFYSSHGYRSGTKRRRTQEQPPPAVRLDGKRSLAARPRPLRLPFTPRGLVRCPPHR